MIVVYNTEPARNINPQAIYNAKPKQTFIAPPKLRPKLANLLKTLINGLSNPMQTQASILLPRLVSSVPN